MLDNLPRAWRHLAIQIIAVLLAWAGSDVVPWMSDQPSAVVAVAGAVLGQLLLVVTPLVRGYGVGSRDDLPAREAVA